MQCPVENLHADEEVHAVDTDTGVVLDAEIDVLADTEAEVAGLGEVALAELILLDLEATLDDLLGLFSVSSVAVRPWTDYSGAKTHLGATDGDVDGDLFVTADTEVTDGVAGLAWRARVSDRAKNRNGGSGVFITYCRQESDQKAARAPWRHG